MTAFLDRAASLCPFLAVYLVCRACLDSGSVCLKVLPCCQTEQVVQYVLILIWSVFHFVGAANFICFSCPLPYFPSYLLFFLVFLFVLERFLLSSSAVLCSCFTPSPFLFSNLNPCLSIAVIGSTGSCCFCLSDDKRKDSRCEQLSPSQISVLVTQPVLSRHKLDGLNPFLAPVLACY